MRSGYFFRSEMSNSDKERVERPYSQDCDSNMPFHTPKPPNLGPVRLPSLIASESTSQWRLSHEESCKCPDQQLSRNNTARFYGPLQDISLSSDLKAEEVICSNSLSTASTDVKAQESLKEVPIPLASSASSGQEIYSNFSGTSIHLQGMRIPQHLRSMSATSVNNSVYNGQVGCSNVIQDEKSKANTNRRAPYRARYTSSTGFESTKVPFTWGRVVRDDASSVYSALPRTSGRSTPESAVINVRPSSAETIHFSELPLGGPSSPIKLGADNVEPTFKKSGQLLEHEQESPSNNLTLAVDGGRSTPSLMKIDDKSPRQINFASSDDNVPKRINLKDQSSDKRKLMKKRSMIQHSTSNLKAFLPRARTRMFSTKNELADHHRGLERRHSKRSKSMYSLHSANKKSRQSNLSKPRPMEDEVFALFTSPSPERLTRSTREEKIRMPKTATPETGMPIHGEAGDNVEFKPTHIFEHECRTEGREESAQAHQQFGSWNKYPSHTRVQRSRNAGPRDNIYPRDFAPQVKTKSSDLFNEITDHSCEKTIASKKVVRSKVAKSKSMVFGKSLLKSYARLFKNQNSEFRQHGHGHRSSISVSGITEYPELEMISAVFPSMGDASDSGQSAVPSRSTSPDARNKDQYQVLATARQWSQMYESCVDLPRISEDISNSSPSKGKAQEEEVQRQRDSISLSGRSLRDSTIDLAKALQASEARERAKAMLIAQGG